MTYSVFAVQVKLVLSNVFLLLMRNNLGANPLINRATIRFVELGRLALVSQYATPEKTIDRVTGLFLVLASLGEIELDSLAFPSLPGLWWTTSQ